MRRWGRDGVSGVGAVYFSGGCVSLVVGWLGVSMNLRVGLRFYESRSK